MISTCSYVVDLTSWLNLLSTAMPPKAPTKWTRLPIYLHSVLWINESLIMARGGRGATTQHNTNTHINKSTTHHHIHMLVATPCFHNPRFSNSTRMIGTCENSSINSCTFPQSFCLYAMMRFMARSCQPPRGLPCTWTYNVWCDMRVVVIPTFTDHDPFRRLVLSALLLAPIQHVSLVLLLYTNVLNDMFSDLARLLKQIKAVSVNVVGLWAMALAAMIDWSIDWLIGRLADWLIDWLVGRMVGWLLN